MKFLLAVALLHTTTLLASPVHVRGSISKQGEYRQPHYRTSPNYTQRDNYSAKGNANPYTGRMGHKSVKR